MRRFDRNNVRTGDRVILRRLPDLRFYYRGMGHYGTVIIRLEDDELPGTYPRDMIVRQKDIALPV